MSYVEFSMRDALKNHVLEEVPGSDKLEGFYLRDPDQGRAMSTLVLFGPEGIVVMGDLCPNLHGSISAYNYGVGWFSKQGLSEDYLCSKFLQQEWQPVLAQSYCYDMALEVRRGQQDEATKELTVASEERSHCLANLRTLHSMRGTPGDDAAAYAGEKEKMKGLLSAQRAKVVECRDMLADRYEQLAIDIEGWGYGMERFAAEVEEIDPQACEDGIPGTGFPIKDAGLLCAIQQRFAELYHERVSVEK